MIYILETILFSELFITRKETTHHPISKFFYFLLHMPTKGVNKPIQYNARLKLGSIKNLEAQALLKLDRALIFALKLNFIRLNYHQLE